MGRFAKALFSVTTILIVTGPLSPNSCGAKRTGEFRDLEGVDARRREARIFAMEDVILAATNAFRQKQGLPALAEDTTLREFARSRSADMAARTYFSHTTPEGKLVYQLMEQERIRYRTVRENIAQNQGYSMQEVATVAMTGWIESPGHRENMGATDVTHLGVGVARGSDGTYYLTQVFTHP